jgi:predicted porin
MKKTLIALAAVAVSSAAMAQVTISGLVGAQFAQEKGTNGTFGLHDADLTFTAAEDLGNGMKVTAKATMNFENGRGSSAKAKKADGTDNADATASTGYTAIEDVTIAISGGFGAVTIGRVEAGNGIIGRGLAGAPVMGADDGIVLAAASNTNIVSYGSPRMAGVQLTGNFTQGTGIFGSRISNLEVAKAESFAVSVGANYAAGPVSAGIDYQQTIKRIRASASLDLGMAKIGAGMETKGGAGDNFVVGVSVPMGAVTVGAAYSANTKDRGTNATTGKSLGTEDATATEVGVSYALSKRTTLSAAYKASNTEAEANIADKYRVRMTHSF